MEIVASCIISWPSHCQNVTELTPSRQDKVAKTALLIQQKSKHSKVKHFSCCLKYKLLLKIISKIFHSYLFNTCQITTSLEATVAKYFSAGDNLAKIGFLVWKIKELLSRKSQLFITTYVNVSWKVYKSCGLR